MVSVIGKNPNLSVKGIRPANTLLPKYRQVIGDCSHLFPQPFTTEWTVAGDAAARTITLPLVAGYSYYCTVDWGDGTAESIITAYDDADRIHTYASDGTRTVKITGVCEGWSFDNGGDKTKITKVINFGSSPAFGGFKYLARAFYGCTNLSSLGTAPIPISGVGPTDLSHFCRNTGITSIPPGLIDKCINVTTISNFFRDCSSITGSIPPDFIRYTINLTAADNLLRGCTGLTGSIPTDFLRYIVNVTNLSGLLKDCTGLTGSIPTDFLRYVTSVTNFDFLLHNCTGLTGSIPTDLLRYVTSATTLNYTLAGCSGLTGSIPTDIFRYITSATTVYSFFYGCTGLTGSIPTDLLKYVTSVTDIGHLLNYCSGLTGSIPSGWLDYVTSLTNAGNVLNGCSGLTGAIPSGFFDYVTSVTNLHSFFENTNLTGYGADLCRLNTACVDFSHMFEDCPYMQHRIDTFYQSGEESTRFLNQDVNFESCFERDSFLGTQGTAADLWNCDFGTGTPTTTDCWEGAGNSAASLTNYASIPAGWK